MMKGYSQQNVADELGINQKHYSKIEGGYVDISITRLFQIAKALDTSVTNLIGLTEDKIFNNIINNQHSEGYKFYYATEIDQLKELYERLLKEKDEIIKLLKEKKRNKKAPKIGAFIFDFIFFNTYLLFVTELSASDL